jgi:hypothetical protein
MKSTPGRRRWIASKRGDSGLGAHVVAHGPADHFAGEKTEDHDQVEPAFAGPDVIPNPAD